MYIVKRSSIYTTIYIQTILLLCYIVASSGSHRKHFPAGFRWGIGSSSYQIEGAWNADGKGESIWDFLTHNHPEKIADRSNGDISADSYHQWRQDVRMLRELHVDTYRFSIAWPRLLPTGYINDVNVMGVNYYNDLIDELLRYNITPMVTIYHWELPQRLQELGGWTNAEIIPVFVDYARLLFDLFGDRVRLWTTVNEPWHVCEFGYGADYMAPSYNFPGIPSYLCGHNLLKAHADVVHLYRDEYAHAQHGQIGITVDTSWPQPKTASLDDRQASERAMQFFVGWFTHPIFSKHGNYPQVMIDRIDRLSTEQGFARSRLPAFTAAEVHRIRGTADFFGINSYTTNLVSDNGDNNTANYAQPSFMHDVGVVEEQDPAWPATGSTWLKVVPQGMYHLLMWIKREYDNPPVIVTENGVSDRGGVMDHGRVNYLHSYLGAVLEAIHDGADVRGYIAWSLMDSYEWKAGYSEKFGFYKVDFADPQRKRIAKLSARVYANICKTNAIDRSWTLPYEVETRKRGARAGAASAATPSATLSTLLAVCVVIHIVRKQFDIRP